MDKEGIDRVGKVNLAVFVVVDFLGIFFLFVDTSADLSYQNLETFGPGAEGAVANGSHCGNVTSSITLVNDIQIGQNGTNRMINGSSCYYVNTSHVIIDGAGYTMMGNGSFVGINLTSVGNVTVKNIHIFNFSTGVFLNNSDNSTILNNTINSTEDATFPGSGGHGIYVSDSENVNITQNEINGSVTSSSGVYLVTNTTNSSITGNSFNASGSGYGIRIENSNNNTITFNNISLMNSGFCIYVDSSGNNISNNQHLHLGIDDGGTSDYCIEILDDENTVVHNNITVEGFENYGARIKGGYNLIDRLNVTSTSHNGIGISIGESPPAHMVGNARVLTGNNLTNSFVTMSGDNSTGVVVQGGTQDYIKNSTIINTGARGVGVSLGGSTMWMFVEWSNITTTGTISGPGKKEPFALNMSDANHTMVSHSYINASNTNDVQVRAGINNSLVNATMANRSNMSVYGSESGEIFLKWSVLVNVTNRTDPDKTISAQIVAYNKSVRETSPQCNDGLDNDADAFPDSGNDPECTNTTDDSEATAGYQHYESLFFQLAEVAKNTTASDPFANFTLTEFRINSNAIIYHGNHTINASNEICKQNQTTSINLSETNSTYVNFTLFACSGSACIREPSCDSKCLMAYSDDGGVTCFSDQSCNSVCGVESSGSNPLGYSANDGSSDPAAAIIVGLEEELYNPEELPTEFEETYVDRYQKNWKSLEDKLKEQGVIETSMEDFWDRFFASDPSEEERQRMAPFFGLTGSPSTDLIILAQAEARAEAILARGPDTLEGPIALRAEAGALEEFLQSFQNFVNEFESNGVAAALEVQVAEVELAEFATQEVNDRALAGFAIGNIRSSEVAEPDLQPIIKIPFKFTNTRDKPITLTPTVKEVVDDHDFLFGKTVHTKELADLLDAGFFVSKTTVDQEAFKSQLQDLNDIVIQPGESIEREMEIKQGITTGKKIRMVFEAFDNEIASQEVETKGITGTAVNVEPASQDLNMYIAVIPESQRGTKAGSESERLKEEDKNDIALDEITGAVTYRPISSLPVSITSSFDGTNALTGAAIFDSEKDEDLYFVELNINRPPDFRKGRLKNQPFKISPGFLFMDMWWNSRTLFSDIYGPYNVTKDEKFIFAQQLKYDPEEFKGNHLIVSRVYRNAQLVTKNFFEVDMIVQENNQTQNTITENKSENMLTGAVIVNDNTGVGKHTSLFILFGFLMFLFISTTIRVSNKKR